MTRKTESPKGVRRAIKTEKEEVVYWKDGGLDIKLDGVWHCRWERGKGYVKVDESRSRFLDGIEKEDLSLRDPEEERWN